MRIRKRSTVVSKSIILMFVALSPVMFVGGYWAGYEYIMSDMKSYCSDQKAPVNTSVYVSVDYDHLHDLANVMDYRYENFHIPMNFTSHALYTDTNYNTVQSYHETYDACLWTGTAMLGQCYRYKVAQQEDNSEELENATRVIWKLLTGMKNMLVIPSGGLGPEYPGVLARSAIPVENASLYPGDYNYIPGGNVVFYGAGPYSNWLWKGHTSRDMLGGYIMGLTAVWYLVDIPEMHALVKLLVEQLYEGFRQNAWLGFDGNGNPTGVETGPSAVGWLASLTLMAATVNPEKYGSLYYYYMTRSGYLTKVNHGSSNSLLMDYYAFNFATDAWYPLMMLEKDDVLHSIWLAEMEKSIYEPTKNHRNAYFNLMYLLYQDKRDAAIEADIIDQLMRFDIEDNPYRAYPADPIPYWYQVDPTMQKWRDFFADTALGGLFLPLAREYDFDQDFYTQPKLVNNRGGGSDFIWQNNAFKVDSGSWTNTLYESSGIDFTTPYWIARYIGIIPSPI